VTGTSASSSTTVVDAAPGYRMFAVRLVRREPLGPSLVRLTLGGEDLRDFGPSGDDQRIKLLIPRTAGAGVLADLGSGDSGGWYAAWLAAPDEGRPHMRTYTVRAARPEAGELDVDVVLHGIGAGHAGPAATWAATAAPGDEIAIVGPDRPGRGRMWGSEWSPPGDARCLLLAGDETAVPAVGAILESLQPGVRATACLEVQAPGDVQSWRLPEGVEVRWAFRDQHPGAAHGDLLAASVREAAADLDLAGTAVTDLEDVDVDQEILWEVPEDGTGSGTLGSTYAWLAGEAAVIKGLRRHLVGELGMPRAAVAFMGYWRLGRAESD
jgi:NADPH-dependent ferric siderophore reductase